MKKIVLFASGSGTNAENIILHFNKKNLGTVVAVFSNNPNAKVLDRAEKLNVPAVIFSKEELNEAKVLQKLNSFQPDLIVLAGFLLKFPQNIIEAYPNKIINIHPALLPKYGGKGMYGDRVHEAVLAKHEKESGITIHYVNKDYDKGDIIFQTKCKIDPGETPDTLAAKVHALEYEHFPRIIEELVLKLPDMY